MTMKRIILALLTLFPFVATAQEIEETDASDQVENAESADDCIVCCVEWSNAAFERSFRLMLGHVGGLCLLAIAAVVAGILLL